MVRKKPPAAAPKLSVLQQLQKLDADQAKLATARSELVAGAKTELLAKGKDIIEGLASLGFVYKLTQLVTGKSHHKAASTKSKSHQAQTVCPICKWQTNPIHDRRAHRWQEVKGPFTTEELKRRKLTRV